MAKAALGDRSLFPNLECKAYLAHAAIAPLSAPVVERIEQVLGSYARGGMVGFGACAPLLKATRSSLASLIGAAPHEIAFVSNTTHGVIDIAFGLRWRPKDRVLLFESEFPANVTPWQQAADEFDLELRWLPLAPFRRSREEGLDALQQELSKGLRL
ncbi:MAG: aminotransferase class V-fold PLP-dependent enzyme, partial [Polyangiales bacterium]